MGPKREEYVAHPIDMLDEQEVYSWARGLCSYTPLALLIPEARGKIVTRQQVAARVARDVPGPSRRATLRGCHAGLQDRYGSSRPLRAGGS